MSEPLRVPEPQPPARNSSTEPALRPSRRRTPRPPPERMREAARNVPPAIGGPGAGVPAGRAIAVLGLALILAAVFNSAAFVRAGEGMDDGLTRTLTLAVARPVHAVSSTVGLDLPRRGLDALVSGDAATAPHGAGLAARADDVVLPPPAAGASPTPPPAGTPAAAAPEEPAAPAARVPTPGDPLEVLVTGDSLATFVGQQLTNLTQDGGLTSITTVGRNGTGLTRPSFFDWQVNAAQEVAQRKPEVVVMVLGGNDGWNLDVDGRAHPPDSDAWEAEYARRVTVVLRTLTDGGQRRVYWSGPPTAADAEWNAIFERQNRAIARAAAAVPGASYVDLFRGTSVDGRYSDYVPIDGERVLARQADGIHWTYGGAVQPARLVLRAMESAFGALR